VRLAGSGHLKIDDDARLADSAAYSTILRTRFCRDVALDNICAISLCAIPPVVVVDEAHHGQLRAA